MESRRAEALQRQQSGRQSKVQTVRDILESAWTHAEDAAAAPAAITAAESTFAVAAAASSASAAAAASTATPSGYRAESAYHRSLRAHWAHQLMMPEPMEHLPSVAASRWMLLSRPEGLRCLVVSRRGRTLSRKKNGSVLHPKFASSLPHGGAVAVTSSAGQPVAVAGASAGEDAAPSTILDCVWNESSGSYVILDALVWNNHHLADTEAEFRLFWIWQKMSEMGATVTSVPAATQSGEATLRYLTLPASPPLVPYAFHLLEPLSCALLPALYPQDPRLARFGARQDGFLFLHRATHYEFGLSQLSLQWKDRACSPYLIEDAGGNGGGAAAAAVPQAAGKQMITLRFCPGRALHTEDEETVGTLDELVYQTVRKRTSAAKLVSASFTSRLLTVFFCCCPVSQSSLRQGDLLLFSIDGIDESPEPLHAASSGAASPSAFASAGDMADEAKSAEAEDGASEESSSAVSLLNLTFVKKASAAVSERAQASNSGGRGPNRARCVVSCLSVRVVCSVCSHSACKPIRSARSCSNSTRDTASCCPSNRSRSNCNCSNSRCKRSRRRRHSNLRLSSHRNHLRLLLRSPLSLPRRRPHPLNPLNPRSQLSPLHPNLTRKETRTWVEASEKSAYGHRSSSTPHSHCKRS